jgi:hypothetical protein
LSAIEIIYYFSLRIIFKILEKRKVSSFERATDKNKIKQNYLVEIMKNSSIHGCNQTVYDGHHRVEKYWKYLQVIEKKFKRFYFRLFWLLIVIVTLFFCCFTTFKIFKNYESAPIIMTYEDVIDTSQDVRNKRAKSEMVIFFVSAHFSRNHFEQLSANGYSIRDMDNNVVDESTNSWLCLQILGRRCRRVGGVNIRGVKTTQPNSNWVIAL